MLIFWGTVTAKASVQNQVSISFSVIFSQLAQKTTCLEHSRKSCRQKDHTLSGAHGFLFVARCFRFFVVSRTFWAELERSFVSLSQAFGDETSFSLHRMGLSGDPQSQCFLPHAFWRLARLTVSCKVPNRKCLCGWKAQNLVVIPHAVDLSRKGLFWKDQVHAKFHQKSWFWYRFQVSFVLWNDVTFTKGNCLWISCEKRQQKQSLEMLKCSCKKTAFINWDERLIWGFCCVNSCHNGFLQT